MSKIDFKIEGIGKFIKENRFSVPIFQRPYSWEAEKHTFSLIEDIKNNLLENDYFLGTIVLTKKENILEIIDGQQRLTTILLFYSVLRDLFELNGKNKKIQENYLSDYDRREDIEIPKLELSQQDNDFYKNFVINRNKDFPASKPSHHLLKMSFEKIFNELKTYKDDESTLLDFMDFIDDKLKVVIIVVPEETNAFTIFETLNDRGLLLAQIDLLKNYLYSRCNTTHLKTVQNNWNELIVKLDSERDSILDYIKVYWLAQYSFIRPENNQLFKAIKEKFRNSAEVNKFVTDLLSDIDIYLSLLNSKHPLWQEFDLNCSNSIFSLNFLELSQFRPLVFAVVKHFNKTETNKALKLILSWMIRNMIVGSTGGGTLEQSYSKNALEISNKKITKASQLRENLKDLIPSDEIFLNAFSIATVSKEKFARYYLREIENYLSGGMNSEKIVNINPDSVNLEHILPKKPENNYPSFNEEDHKEFLKRIGNLTIMSTKLNNKQKSVKFDTKKTTFENSDIKITKEIAKYSDWNIAAIEKRQSELAENAVKVWTIKFENND